MTEPDLRSLGEEELLELYTSLHQADRELRHNAIAYYEPHRVQGEFHGSKARIRILLGGNRSGKVPLEHVRLLHMLSVFDPGSQRAMSFIKCGWRLAGLYRSPT